MEAPSDHSRVGTLQEVQIQMSLTLQGLVDQQYEILRLSDDRKSMGYEDDRSHLIESLNMAYESLNESQVMQAKLEGKYSVVKRDMRLMMDRYEEMQRRVGLVQNTIKRSSIASSSHKKPEEDIMSLQKLHGVRDDDFVLPPNETMNQPKNATVPKIKRVLSTKSATVTVAAVFSRGEAEEKKRRSQQQEEVAAVVATTAPDPVPASGRIAADENQRAALRNERRELEAGAGWQMHDPGRIWKKEDGVSSVAKRPAAVVAGVRGESAAAKGRAAGKRSPPLGARPQEMRYKQTNLTKEARAQLPGHACAECDAFYIAQKAKGTSSQDIREILNNCSRHRQQWSPDHTPEGFWDMSAMSMPTPRPLKKRPLEDIV